MINKILLIGILASGICISQGKKEYRLKREAFIARYCADDSLLKNTANIYFEARKQSLRKAYALPISLGLTVACVTVYLTQQNNVNNVAGLAIYGVVFGGISSLISIPFTPKGIRSAHRYSRKVLYEEIQMVKKGDKTSKQLLEETIRDYYVDFGSN